MWLRQSLKWEISLLIIFNICFDTSKKINLFLVYQFQRIFIFIVKFTIKPKLFIFKK